MIEKKTFDYLMENKVHWIKLDGGISNKVFNFNNQYIIKLIDKRNDNLFLSLSNYYKLLENFDTTLYLDKINNIIIEKYIQGQIVSNENLFSAKFCIDIFNLIDRSLYPINPIINNNIEKKNIIKFYINQLSTYIKQKNISSNNLDKIDNLVLGKISKYMDGDDFELYFSHNDIQKYNIIIGLDNQINLIDYEYAGYTWKYFDHINFIVLILNEKITNKMNTIDEKKISEYCNLEKYQKIFFSLYTETSLEYFNSILIISAYTWYLWSIVKYNLGNDSVYLEYSKQMELIINYIINYEK